LTEVALPGCRPEPLASYLKSLGVLRLVTEQTDSSAEGWWKGGRFRLGSAVDGGGLVEFLAGSYEPTPIVSPWNGGSGFYEGDDVSGRDAIISNGDGRLKLYRETIMEVMRWPEIPRPGAPISVTVRELEREFGGRPGRYAQALRELKGFSKGASGLKARKLRTAANKLVRDARKPDIVMACRNRLGPKAVEWVDAAVVMDSWGGLAYPPLLASGGIEGRLDYSNRFMAAVGGMLGPENAAKSRGLLRNALFGTATEALARSSPGQFDPGRAGGPNQSAGIEQRDSLVNPWDFILAMEGAIALAGSVSRRGTDIEGGIDAGPFTVRLSPVGYPSASVGDVASANGEFWAPVWEKPAGYAELREFLSDGRALIGGRRAETGLEFLAAMASGGVDRGIIGFVRYGLLRRRGSSLLAAPLGRFPVVGRNDCRLLGELNPALTIVDRHLRSVGGREPRGMASVRRAVDIALYELLTLGGAPDMKALVASLGRLERAVSSAGDHGLPLPQRPLGGLSPDWISACDDGTVEVRLAAALASVRGSGTAGPLRANLSPVDPRMPRVWADERNIQQSWVGNSFPLRMMSALERRLRDHDHSDGVAPPFSGLINLHPADIAAFIDGGVDDDLIEDLLFGFTLVEWNRPGGAPVIRRINERWSDPVEDRPANLPWALLKMLFPSDGIAEVRPTLDPAVLGLLRAGKVAEACNLGRMRLFMAGIAARTLEQDGACDGARLGASLLIPVKAGPADLGEAMKAGGRMGWS
jgi:CRISPR-associated protein Csx17